MTVGGGSDCSVLKAKPSVILPVLSLSKELKTKDLKSPADGGCSDAEVRGRTTSKLGLDLSLRLRSGGTAVLKMTVSGSTCQPTGQQVLSILTFLQFKRPIPVLT